MKKLLLFTVIALMGLNLQAQKTTKARSMEKNPIVMAKKHYYKRNLERNLASAKKNLAALEEEHLKVGKGHKVPAEMKAKMKEFKAHFNETLKNFDELKDMWKVKQKAKAGADIDTDMPQKQPRKRAMRRAVAHEAA